MSVTGKESVESTSANQDLFPRLAEIWWAGARLLLQWFAVGIVAGIVSLPVMLVIGLIGGTVGLLILGIFLVVAWPILVGLTARYLHLFGQGERGANDRQGGTNPVVGCGEGGLRRRIAAGMVVAFLLGMLMLSPSPDPLSALILGTAAAILCVVPLLVLARSRLMKSASPSVQTLIVALVCILAVLLLLCLLFAQRQSRMHEGNATAGSLIPTVGCVSS